MKTLSPHALCAKSIRQELKLNFPGIKFSVSSESFAGGNAVNISYEDGVIRGVVEEIVSKYQYGSFNGMEDYYDITNRRNDVPQVKFVSTTRHMSESAKKIIAEELAQKFNIDVKSLLDYNYYHKDLSFSSGEIIYREFIKRNFN